jgi:hypothetical protein
MKYAIVALLMAGGFVAISSDASALVCARGIYRAGCVGTVGAGAVVVRHPVVVAPRGVVVRRRVY